MRVEIYCELRRKKGGGGVGRRGGGGGGGGIQYQQSGMNYSE